MNKFLVAYDYGMGAQWAFVLAPSVDAVMQRFPDLTVFTVLPSWWGTRGFEDSTPEFSLDQLGPDWLGRADKSV
jgi:hypothetical protein